MKKNLLFVALFIVSRSEIKSLEAEIDLLKAQKDELAIQSEKEKNDLEAQVTLLSNQVAEQIAKEEIENAKNTIPLVEANSRLGYEKEYGYSCCKMQLEWKIAMAEKTINEELLPLLAEC